MQFRKQRGGRSRPLTDEAADGPNDTNETEALDAPVAPDAAVTPVVPDASVAPDAPVSSPDIPSGSRNSPRRSRSLPSHRDKGTCTDDDARRVRHKRTNMGQVELYLDKRETESSYFLVSDKSQDRKKSLSEEETTTTTESTSKAGDEKRQKFDSGFGEDENTPSSSGSPDKSGKSDSDCCSHPSSSFSDDDQVEGECCFYVHLHRVTLNNYFGTR